MASRYTRTIRAFGISEINSEADNHEEKHMDHGERIEHSMMVQGLHTGTVILEDEDGASQVYLSLEFQVQDDDTEGRVVLICNHHLAIGLVIAAGKMLQSMTGGDVIEVPSEFDVEDILRGGRGPFDEVDGNE